MPGIDSPRKTSFKITLNESVVFLHPTRSTGRSRSGDPPPPSSLRGLLILELTKPTRITSIELDLQAKSITSWPDGIGARRVDVTEEHEIFHASTVYFRASDSEARRTESVGPGILSSSRAETDPTSSSSMIQGDATEPHQSPESAQTSRNPRMLRRISADNSIFQPMPISRHSTLNPPPTPPYSPFPTPPNSTPSTPAPHNLSTVDENTAQTLDSMQTMRPEARSARQRQSLGGFADFISLSPAPSRPASRRPSSTRDVPEEDSGPSAAHQSPRTASNGRTTSHSRTRDRRGSRFNLSSVSSILMDVVRSSSQKPRGSGEPSEDGQQRGRTKEKRPLTESERGSARSQGSNEASRLGRLGEFLKPDDDKQMKEGWKEFKKGTYTYPISFTIPGNSPPSLHCAFGSVVWRLKAIVHRPGTFAPKLAATREVKVIASPLPEDAEEETVVVEREWEQQLHYQIILSGRHFYIGGQAPLTIALMPLSKIKIHQISVYIEERVDYYTQMKRIARTDPLNRIDLLVLKSKSKLHTPILPLQSDDADAFKQSPLSVLLNPGNDASELASSFMGPGPWKICQQLQLPSLCSALRYTNKNRRSNVVISHTLKCIIRLERGDDLCMDPKTGKRKLYDIMVQAPIQILSCRCNPNWSTLPEYTEFFNDPDATIDTCPCSLRRPTPDNDQRTQTTHPFGPVSSRQSSESGASVIEGSPVRLQSETRRNDSLYLRNAQFERLVAGQESEVGEAPPTYDISMRI